MKPELADTLEVTATSGRLPAASRALAVGQQLGHFRIERRLGAGGMGEVYLATDLALDRSVAIKVLPDELARDAKRRERLVREARAQARISHPNVGHIYFIGEAEGLLYFAMEYVHGKTVAEAIAAGPLGVDDALAIVRGAALGLREAHRQGFTHRDVKPSNLMLDGHGMVKVLDFGLAAGDAGAIGSGPVAQTSLGGTPLYMAPEQARGQAVDLRADIYALGATLYHLISGKPPFVADSVDELLTLHATSARPAVPRRGIPRTQLGAIDALIARMMAARPEDRFASYDDLLRAIDLISTAQTRPAGFWVRLMAMAIDFALVSFVLEIAFTAVNSLGGIELRDEPATLPVLLVYHALATARWGRTAGKAMFEVEVVDTVAADRPTFSRALRRSLAMLGIPVLATWAAATNAYYELTAHADDLEGVVVAVIVLGGLLVLLHGALRVAGKRALWDRYAGTMVRYRTSRTAGG